MARFGKNISGFTMIEIIAVLIIIGTLSAVAVSRIFSTQSYEAASEVDILKMHLRYAQLRALSDVGTWGISISNDGSKYKYTIKQGTNDGYNLPNENSPTHTLPSEITVSVAGTTTANTVTFDEWGSPSANGAYDIVITMTPGGTITITKNTGFIP